ncbi:magnesium transporter CorA family protein [Lacticaseibacillus baoqingensis]|uniref:Magnesium transporter CorA family protein n=1 Tax=Lacticaseibacillus baoqingensis TaxID=2486013 RepID=A0ABW4E1U6_9LACO|nr:magnesium transporter CorA family protein [Lacticaseibacillus baoqingensis]
MQTQYQINARQLQPTTTAGQWLRVCAPDKDELEALANHYQLPFDYWHAGLDPHEDPRVVGVHPEAQHPTLVVVRVPFATHNAQGDQVFETKPLALILVKDQLITVAAQPLAVVDAFIAKKRAVDDAEDLALALIQAVLDEFVANTDQMDAQTRDMETRLATAARNTLLYEIIALERSLVYFDSALTMTQAVVKKLAASARVFTTDAHLYRLHAVNVECGQALTVVNCSRALLDQYNTAVSAIVGNNLNLIMKVLTSVSIIMTIPAIVSGIWGMNTWLPFRTGMTGFFFLLGLIGVLCGSCAWLLKKKGYF